jgi:tetratricopeptide (TPR) repeat protein
LLFGCSKPDHGTILEQGMEALARGRYTKAVPLLTQAAKSDPDSATAQGNLGVALWHTGELEDAAEAFRKAAALADEKSRALAFLGHVYMQLGDWPQANEALSLALSEDPLSPSLLTAQARAQRELGKPHAARVLLRDALEASPGYAPALFGMAVMAREAGDLPQAELYFKRLLAARDTGSEAEAARTFLAGRKQADDNRTDPAPVIPPNEGAQRLVQAARRALERREYESALLNLKRAVERYPNEPDAMWELAVLYDRHLEFKDRAAEQYRAFKERFPEDPRTRHIPALPEISPRPQPAEIVREAFDKGLSAYKAGNWAQAILEFKRALAFDRNHADAAYNLALAYKAAEQLDNARENFLLALKLRPNTSEARYMLALIARTQGRSDEAVTQLQLVLRSNPQYAKAHLLLGYVYQDKGQRMEARKHFTQYIRLAPDEPSARRIRKWLDGTQ